MEDEYMHEFNNTIKFQNTTIHTSNQIITIFDAEKTPFNIDLSSFQKNVISFGREEANDIVLTSHLVSRQHGQFVYRNCVWVIEDKNSRNGLLFNHYSVSSRVINDGGDFIRIDDGVETISEGVLFVFSSAESLNTWHTIPIEQEKEITIGRLTDCDIQLPHVSVSGNTQKSSMKMGNMLSLIWIVPTVYLSMALIHHEI